MQGKEKKYKETQQYILFTIKYMLEANINFYIKNFQKEKKKKRHQLSHNFPASKHEAASI